MSMNMGGGSGNVSSALDAFTAGKSAAGDLLLQNVSGGNVGIGVGVASTRLDIGAGAIEGDEMTDPGAGAANTYRLFAEDNGAGKTRLMVRFASGAAQQIAIQP